MSDETNSGRAPPSGDQLLQALAALSSPFRMRIVAALAGRRQYVSQLAREIGISRPLLHMHLRRLRSAGLIESHLEVSEDGKAMNYVSIAPFALVLTPETIAQAALTLSPGTQSSAISEDLDVQEEDR